MITKISNNQNSQPLLLKKIQEFNTQHKTKIFFEKNTQNLKYINKINTSKLTHKHKISNFCQKINNLFSKNVKIWIGFSIKITFQIIIPTILVSITYFFPFSLELAILLQTTCIILFFSIWIINNLFIPTIKTLKSYYKKSLEFKKNLDVLGVFILLLTLNINKYLDSHNKSKKQKI